MDLQTLSLIISIGAIIGTAVATFFANKKSSSEKVNRAVIADQEVRIKQLEDDGERKDKTISDYETRIKQLETEKALPLEQLTALIISNNKQQTALLKTIVGLLKEKKR